MLIKEVIQNKRGRFSLFLIDRDEMSYLYVFLISMLPIIELRGSIIYARSIDLNVFISTIVAVIGNMIVVPFIFFYARKFIEFGMSLKYVNKFFEYVNKKGIMQGKSYLILKIIIYI